MIYFTYFKSKNNIVWGRRSVISKCKMDVLCIRNLWDITLNSDRKYLKQCSYTKEITVLHSYATF